MAKKVTIEQKEFSHETTDGRTAISKNGARGYILIQRKIDNNIKENIIFELSKILGIKKGNIKINQNLIEIIPLTGKIKKEILDKARKIVEELYLK